MTLGVFTPYSAMQGYSENIGDTVAWVAREVRSLHLAKIRAKPLTHAEWSEKPTWPGEFLWFDTSSVQTPST